MFTIQQTSYIFDLEQYLFCADSITPLVFEVTASSLDDWNDDIMFYAYVNNRAFTPLLLQDVTDGNNPLSKNFVLYLDKIVKYFMDDFLDFEQILESDTVVENILKVFNVSAKVINLENGQALSDTYSANVNFMRGANQLGQNEYIATQDQLTAYLNQNEDSDYREPSYNYDTYHAVSGMPFYVYYLITDDLSPYYDFYIGGTFENKFALNEDSTLIFSDHNNNYFII